MRLFAAIAVAAMVPISAAADCATDLRLLTRFLDEAAFSLTDVGQLDETAEGCRLTGIAAKGTGYLGIEIGAIDWRSEGIGALIEGGQPTAVALDLTVTGARILPQPPDAWLAWMLDMQNRRNLIAGRLRAHWDLEAGVLDIAEISADFPGRSGFQLAWRASGLGLPDTGGGLAGLRLEWIEGEIENEGYFDGPWLAFLTERMRGAEGGPEAEVARLTARALAVVAALPEPAFPEPTRAALTALIENGPAPWGRLSVSLDAPRGVGLDRFLQTGLSPDPLSPAALATLTEGLSIALEFTPWVGRE